MHLRSQMSLRPRSRDKLKTKYFFFQKRYGHQTVQGADVWWGEAQN